jgi:putative flippase GtrA
LSAIDQTVIAEPRLPAQLRQLFRFGLVGGSGAVAFVLLSTLAVEARTGAPDWLVSVVSYAGLILPVYLMHRRFSFRSAAPHGQALPRYVAVQAMAVLLAGAVSLGVYAVPGLPTIAAAVLVSGLTAAFTFALLKLWAFAAAR